MAACRAHIIGVATRLILLAVWRCMPGEGHGPRPPGGHCLAGRCTYKHTRTLNDGTNDSSFPPTLCSPRHLSSHPLAPL